jgi:hypothetical protein
MATLRTRILVNISIVTFTKIYNIGIYLCLLILLSLKLYNCNIFFGHLLITSLSYNILILLILGNFIILNIFSIFTNLRFIKFLQLVLITQILTLLLFSLWASINYFSIVLCLDCINLIIILLLILDSQITEAIDTIIHSINFVGLAIYFWTSFIATILLFFGGILLLNYYTFSNFNILLMILPLSKLSLYMNTTIFNIFLLFFVCSLFIKAGIGPFYIWKRYTFASMQHVTLIIYLFNYFMYLFLYIVYILISISILADTILSVIIFILIIASIFMLINCIDTGIKFSDFFVISTLLNTILILIYLNVILLL